MPRSVRSSGPPVRRFRRNGHRPACRPGYRNCPSGLVDICLPTRLHAEAAVRAMQAGRDVLIELPLADTLAGAYRIVEVQRETGRRAFVDMFSRFSPSNRHLREAVADQRYGQLRVLEIEARTVVLLGYPQAVARLTSSSLMQRPYEIRGGYRATFTDAVLEYEMRREHRSRPEHPDRDQRRRRAPHRPARHQALRGDDRPRSGLPDRPSRQHHRRLAPLNSAPSLAPVSGRPTKSSASGTPPRRTTSTRWIPATHGGTARRTAETGGATATSRGRPTGSAM
ncbi:Gfo/Idh/MocA family oxidoreductase [Kribbella sp. NPDC026596]|uniref:Gfo/Idh/MocA family protein n=1 Tax=Kribbella sp. NPDC026596 TaxID=3155122 RepID=UPI0033CEFCCA